MTDMAITAETVESSTAEPLSLVDELILIHLDEKGGYFHQVPGWQLNCAVVVGVPAELSFRSRLDSDLASLFVVDPPEAGDPVLDPILREIVDAPGQRTARYWIERLASRAESIIEMTLARLVEREILQRHDGEFWMPAATVLHGPQYGMPAEGTPQQFIEARIGKVVFADEIPGHRDIVIACLVNSCDVFRLILELDEKAEERIKYIFQMDLIGRAIADAVSRNLDGPARRYSALSKKIPTVPMRQLPANPHIRDGNLITLFGHLPEEHGPVFRVHPPFSEPMIFLAGLETNRWVHKQGRTYLRTEDYFNHFEKVYGADDVLPALDGADHFRLRKLLSPAYSRARPGGQMDQLYDRGRAYMTSLTVGDSCRATSICRALVSTQLSPLVIGVDTQDLMDDLMAYKERDLSVHIAPLLPKFTVNTPGMKRRAIVLDTLMERVLQGHTSAHRADNPRNLGDDSVSLHASDPRFLPESNLLFAFSAALIASVYLGDAFSLMVYAMASQLDLYAKIQAETDALFANGDPEKEDFTPANIDVTHRFLPSRKKRDSLGSAPYELDTHRCLGTGWMEMHLAVNLLMLAHHFTVEVSPAKYARELRFNPFPSMMPSMKLKFRISEQRRELPA